MWNVIWKKVISSSFAREKKYFSKENYILNI